MIDTIRNIYIGHSDRINYFIFWMIILAIFSALYLFKKNLLKKAFNHRYLIGFVLIVLLTLFQISGSSIGCWSKYIPESASDGVILGHSQLIRSDEWALFTPYAFSQKYNHYNYFSDIIRGTTTDVYLEYGTPVLNLGIIYKLFQAGYLLLGSGMGLAFYWNTRLIVLVLASIEFMLLITNKNKKLSVVGAMLIAFSPLVSWWFSINGLVEMIISFEIAVVLFDKYLNLLSQSPKKKSSKAKPTTEKNLILRKRKIINT